MFRRLLNWNAAFFNSCYEPTFTISPIDGRRRKVERQQSLCANAGDSLGGTFKVGAVLKRWQQIFLENNVSEPLESAAIILGHALKAKKISDVYKLSNKVLAQETADKMERLCKLRLKRMPVQYIIEEWDFRDLLLKMSPPVFIPRPETEMIVDLALEEIDKNNIKKCLELCCGSGAISLALLKARPELEMIALDQSPLACKLTEENATLNQLFGRLTVINHKIAEDNPLKLGKFDLVVANPPYVPSKDVKDLQPEILRYEDLSALDGGVEGLDVIKIILNTSPEFLNTPGKLLLEVDPSHPWVLKTLLERNNSSGLYFSRIYKDFCDKERFVQIIKK